MGKVSEQIDIVLYTDGGCHGNPGPGGWAWRGVGRNDEVLSEGSGYAEHTTNNRMELTAVIRALAWTAESAASSGIVVRTDSQYVRHGITDWIYRWKKNGWQTTAKKPVKNAELWRRLDELNERVKPQWEWVKGHAGDTHNEACDAAVQVAIRSQGNGLSDS